MKPVYATDQFLRDLEAESPYSPKPVKVHGRLFIGFGHALRRGERFTELPIESARVLLALDADWISRIAVREGGLALESAVQAAVRKCLKAGVTCADDVRAVLGLAPRLRKAA